MFDLNQALKGDPLNITFLYFEDCPSHNAALDRLKNVMTEEGIDAPVKIIKIETDEEAERRQFIGSPTILIDGRDIDPPQHGASPALTCRTYHLEDGRFSPLPSVAMIRRGLRGEIPTK